MESIRFLLYVAAVGCAFLILTAIKALSPEKEYEPPIDKIGIKLYRPIFFGKKEETKKQIVKTVIKEAPIKELPDEVSIEQEAVIVPENIDSSNDETFFLEMIQGYKDNVLSERKYRNDVVVRYYKHGPDGDNALVLVDYGFYLHIRPVNKDRYETLSSNVIYYGHEFPERDLKLITYLLVKNGIPIKRLQPFKNYDGWKKKAIEIGGNPNLTDATTLTLAEIRSFSVKR